MKKLLISTIILTFSGNVLANCENVRGKKYAECIENNWAKSDANLKKAFNKAYSETPWYSQPNFSDAQKAWQKYRDAECEYQVSLNSLASHAPTDSPVQMDQCLTELNQKRIIELKNN